MTTPVRHQYPSLVRGVTVVDVRDGTLTPNSEFSIRARSMDFPQWSHRNFRSPNGQLRPLQIRDRTVAVDDPVTERADPTLPSHIASPFAGVVTLGVVEGDDVVAGQSVATIEAMKMEASITSQLT